MQPRQPRAAQQPRAPKIDVEKAVGLTFYNIEKVAKKIGVKKSSETFDKLASIFNSFNRELKQVKRINTFLFSEGKSKMEAAQKEAMKNRDFSALQKANKEVTESFKPIIKVIEEKEEKLDTEIEKMLTDKQQKKWVKYKTNLKKK
jgi:Zn-dependent M32 family carboxypeptidase